MDAEHDRQQQGSVGPEAGRGDGEGEHGEQAGADRMVQVQQLHGQKPVGGSAVEPGGEVEQEQAGQAQGQPRWYFTGDACLGDQQRGRCEHEHAQARKAGRHTPRRDRRREQHRGDQPQNGRLHGEAPEDAAPHAELNKKTADQRSQQRACPPDHRLDPEQPAPQMVRERLLNGDVTQRQQRAAADPLHEARRQQGRHVRRQCRNHAAYAVNERSGHGHPLEAMAVARHRRRGAGDDGADLVQRDGPGDVGNAADVGDDRRHRGGGDQGNRPRAARPRHEQGKAPELAGIQDFPPRSCADIGHGWCLALLHPNELYNLNLSRGKEADAPGNDGRRGGGAQRAVGLRTPFLRAPGLIRSWRTSGNQRRYARDVLRRVALIQVGQQLGISLAEIGAALAALPPDGTPSRGDWEAMARIWSIDLDRRIASLLERFHAERG